MVGHVDGYRHSVTSADGTKIGLLTAGEGPPLLLVHGGMGQIESWQSLWPALTGRWRVTAMDRRGRGASAPPGPVRAARPADCAAGMAGPRPRHDRRGQAGGRDDELPDRRRRPVRGAHRGTQERPARL